MGILKLPVVLSVLFIALNHLEGGGKPTKRQEWIVSALPRNMLLELKGADPEHEANPKVIRWKSGNAALPLARLNAWQIF
uniref:Islet amyloid polypeptide n=1 Tax=Capra hircus TaxID=9925 RepID=A0A8C2SJA3_CAPHI